jgi:hypothetical protein
MTPAERELLLIVARWCEQLGSGTAADPSKPQHLPLRRLRDLIAIVEKTDQD